MLSAKKQGFHYAKSALWGGATAIFYARFRLPVRLPVGLPINDFGTFVLCLVCSFIEGGTLVFDSLLNTFLNAKSPVKQAFTGLFDGEMVGLPAWV